MTRATIVLLIVLLSTGCASETKPPARGDRAALVVRVVAQPKKGVHESSGGYSGSGPTFGQFEKVDYDHLDEIVVWVDAAGGDRSLRAIPLKSPGVVSADDVFVFETGQVQSAGAGAFAPRLAGYVERQDSSGKVVGSFYVVSTPFARVARAGDDVRFDDLPVGAATVCAWHARLPGSRSSVELTAGKTSRVDAIVSVNVLPKAP